MPCPSCGAAIQPDDVFCGSCGTRVAAPVRAPEAGVPGGPAPVGGVSSPPVAGPAGLGTWTPPPPRTGAGAPAGGWGPPPAGQGAVPPPPGSAPSTLSYEVVEPSFLSSLFDFSFQTMITPRIIKLLYVLVIVGAGLTGLALLAAGLTSLEFAGPRAIILVLMGPVSFLVTAVYGRVLLEVIVIFFKMGDEVSQIRERAFEE